MAQNLPNHIAFIMDGNRRWTKGKSLPVLFGHKNGVDTFENILGMCAKKGMRSATFYAFSTENWNRDENEVKGLLRLLSKNCKRFLDKCHENNLKFKLLGDLARFDKKLQEKLKEAVEKTKENTGMTVNVALNYGGRAEIARAAQKCVDKGLKLDEENIGKNLDTYPQEDPDMIVRTGGDQRLSNFLTWQSTYSELYFTETLWPDFDEKKLEAVLAEYTKRKRRFGK